MARPKKVMESKEELVLIEELEENIPYELDCPSEIVMKEIEFDSRKMFPYKWSHRGVFYSGGHKMVSIRVDGKK